MAIKKRSSPVVSTTNEGEEYPSPQHETALVDSDVHHSHLEDIDETNDVISQSVNHPQSSSLAAAGDDPSSANYSAFRGSRRVVAGKKRIRLSVFSAAWMGLVCFGLLIIYVSWSSIHTSNEEVSQLLSIKEKSDKQIKSFEEKIRLLVNDISEMDAKIHKDKDGSETEGGLERAVNVNNLQGKVDALSGKADSLKEQVQEMSRKEAIQKYGSGIHRVKIELAFPDGMDGPDYFVIELAPMELMPHSVHFFLEMVSTRLLDGCSFILNALNVLKVAPLPYDGSSAAEKARAFTKQGLESVAFKEYSDKFPHKLYTVGFAADGSPSFYINTEDNTEIHVGDPCFGKIVEGLDAVKRLEMSPTRNGIWFDRRIGIRRATILSDSKTS